MVLSDDFYYQPIRLDTINTQIYTDLIAKEGDAGGRGLKVTITENGVTKNTTGITLNLKWEHTAVADLQGLEPFEAVDLTKGIYKLKYPTNMLQKGTVKALIQIIDNGGLAGSRNLKIKVDSTVGDDTAMESSNEFAALVTALVKTNHMENLLNETIANVTVDSEVITARNSTAKQKTFTVLDERMEDLEKDVYYPANNELTQADFAATTGWSVYQGTLAVANNVASVTGTSGLYPNVYQDINCEVGDKLYYAAQARVTTAGATTIALRSEGVEITTDNARVLAPLANQWYQLDCIKTAFETTPSFAVSQRYALAADATGKVLQIKKPIALNLTKIFGANAIPTIEQIRAILSRFTDSHFVGNEGLSQPALLMGKALSLEAQFNAAVAGLTVDDETINARVGKDNTTHATLKARLDSEKSTTDQSLVSLSQQLEQTLNKSAITLTHMFADNPARDAYFVANPTELVEQLFIKVGTGYQQYLEGAWQASSAIVAEQVSATNQPITDTGNYFTTDNTNAALQEMGAHKASTANPHGVTKAQVGLGNVDNTSDANKPVSTAGQTALNLKANKVQEAWITPTLLNGATGNVQYRKNELGRVEFKGKLTVTATFVTAFNLPTGYQLGYDGNIPVKTGTTTLSTAYLRFISNLCYLQSGALSEIDFSGISYVAGA